MGNEIHLRFDTLNRYRQALVYKGKANKTSFSIKDLILPLTAVNGNTITISAETVKKYREIAIAFTDKFGRKTEPIFILLKQN